MSEPKAKDGHDVEFVNADGKTIPVDETEFVDDDPDCNDEEPEHTDPALVELLGHDPKGSER